MQRFGEGLTDCDVKITALLKHARIISPMGQDLEYMSRGEKMSFADSGPDASKETFDVFDVQFCESFGK